MRNAPEQLLKSIFGFPVFRPGQREIVKRLLAGAHTLVVMPTGAGKSLCYQLSALLNDRPTIVVSPLVALMDDQAAALKANGIDVGCIHSGRSRAENVEDWRRVQAGAAKLLYMSPERLMTDRMLAALDAVDPAMFVVDEAHCISKWGASFRPEYETLSELKDRFPTATLAAFTATADSATRQDINKKIFGGRGEIIVFGFDRPNLRLGVAPKTDWRRQLFNFLEPRRNGAGIVYCLSRRLTEEVAALLAKEGYRALPYHAGLPAGARRENQEIFMAEEGVIMVATIAFGMGIDKSDIRHVLHLNLPGSMEAYYQEIGRAGRDGKAAEVQMLYALDDIRMRRRFIDQEASDEDHKRREHKRLDSLLAYCEATQCRRVALLAYFGEASSPCANCDVCLDPPTVIDGTTEARMLLSAIARTGQRFGAAHIIDVLVGSTSEKIHARGHDQLPNFGAGQSHPKSFWRAFIRQAVAGGYLSIDIERFGGLKLSQKGEAVLKGIDHFYFREIPKPTASAKTSKRAHLSLQSVDDIDTELLTRLKALRREFALERGVPAFVIFSDATLHDMCRLRPATLEQMIQVGGVGPKKLKDFGKSFLDAINADNSA
ncbi:MAG: DNA helicase RecQ [Alphaproteobacteria bacterium]|nr:DNA helicase RecQ [Alphaproteobacteria bacterium]